MVAIIQDVTLNSPHISTKSMTDIEVGTVRPVELCDEKRPPIKSLATSFLAGDFATERQSEVQKGLNDHSRWSEIALM